MFRSRFILTAVVAVVAALAAPTTSQAAFFITVDDGPGGAAAITITDAVGAPVVGGDINPNANMIQTLAFVYAGYEVSFTATNTSPGGFIPGTGIAGRVTENVFSIRQIAAAPLPLTITTTAAPPEAGFTFAGSGDLVYVINRISASALDSGTLAMTTTVSPTTGGGGSSTTAVASISAPGFDQTTLSGVQLTGSPFAISQTLTITGMGGIGATANITGTSTVVLAPAPAGLVMLAGALPFAGLLRLRRRGQTATPATAA